MAFDHLAETEPRPTRAAGTIDYVRPYKFLFSSPNWLANWGLLLVCLIIPYVGQIVAYGYLYEQMEKWIRTGSDAHYDDFQFNRFVDFLTRGLWPFLIEFMQQIVIFPIVIGFVIAINISLQSMMGPGKPPDVDAALRILQLYGLMFFVLTLLSFLMTFLVTPMMLRAGLMQELKGGLSIRFVGEFLKRTWGLMIATFVAQFIAGLLLMVGGLLLFCVGLWFTMVLVIAARFHFQYQLYEVYLARGGEPIPLKEPKTPFLQPPVHLPD